MFSELIKTTKGNIVIGGDYEEKSCYIAPTVIENVQPDDSTMQDEIFGPILPMLDCHSLGELLKNGSKIENRNIFHAPRKFHFDPLACQEWSTFILNTGTLHFCSRSEKSSPASGSKMTPV